MSLTWTRVPAVATGDLVTSKQARWLAQAVNERLRWSVPYLYLYLVHLFRWMRLPEGLLEPSQIETLVYYLHLDPEDGQWPITGPDDPGGSNRSNLLNLFVFGNPDYDFLDEGERLGDVPLWINGGPPSTDSEAFWLAAMQRGAVDPVTGSLNTPARTAARSHWGIRSSYRSPYGNDYGGFVASPTRNAGVCSDGSDSFEIKFTAIDLEADTSSLHGTVTTNGDGYSVVTYDGTCVAEEDHVAGVAPTAWAYYVFLYDGAGDPYLADILPTSDWIEGPYTGYPYIRHNWGDHIHRFLLFNHARDFRGSTSQRERPDYNNESAFDFQQYLTSQNLLAPNRGHLEGDDLVADIPQATFTRSVPAGNVANWAAEGPARQWHEGFVLGSALVTADGLEKAVVIEFWDNTANARVGSVSLTPNAVGHAEKSVTFLDGSTPTLVIRNATDLVLDANGRVDVWATELEKGKPDIADAYLLLRLASTQSDHPTCEGQGTFFERSPEVWRNYKASGAALNVRGNAAVPAQDTLIDPSITKNPLYQTARRVARRCLRVIPPQQWFGGDPIIESYYYENGKPVLICTRNLNVAGVQKDLFDDLIGIGAAEKAGWSNRWFLQVNPRNYRDSAGSIWHPDVYGDRYAWVSRCHVSPNAFWPAELRMHWNYDLVTDNRPEAVGAHTYVRDINGGAATATQEDFCASCRLWEPAVEVESCEPIEEEGVQKVKITLTGHLHRHPNAPDSVPRSPGNWSSDDLERLNNTHASYPEDFRTDDNALREWSLFVYDGTNATFRTGDAAIDSTVSIDPDPPEGAAWPYLIFVRQVPEPYEDDNESYQVSDTPADTDWTQQIELYLRGICSAFVDGITSAELGCQTGLDGLYDFTYENLVYQATGNRWTPLLPAADRPDNPQGFGPLPNTYMYAAGYNDLAAMVNLLDKLRIDVPYAWEEKYDFYTGEKVVVVDDGTDTCTLGGPDANYADTLGAPSPGTFISSTGWYPTGYPPVVNCQQIAELQCDGTNWKIVNTRTDHGWRLTYDAAYEEAIPEELRELWDDGWHGVMALWEEERYHYQRQAGDSGNTPDCGGIKPFGDGGGGYYQWVQVVDYSLAQCVLVESQGVNGAGLTPPMGDYATCYWTSPSPGGHLYPGHSAHNWDLSLYDPAVVYVRIPLEDPE